MGWIVGSGRSIILHEMVKVHLVSFLELYSLSHVFWHLVHNNYLELLWFQWFKCPSRPQLTDTDRFMTKVPCSVRSWRQNTAEVDYLAVGHCRRSAQCIPVYDIGRPQTVTRLSNAEEEEYKIIIALPYAYIDLSSSVHAKIHER